MSTRNVNKIDIHSHWLPRKIPAWKEKFGYGGFITLEHCGECRARMVRDDGKVFREVESNLWDATRRLRECDEQSVSLQVLSTVPVMFGYGLPPRDALECARFLNDDLARPCLDHPTRFAGLATVPLQDPELAVQELERAVKELGLKGVQIGSHIGHWNLDARELDPFWQACERLSVSVFVHPWEMMGEERMPKYWLPWLVGMPAETSLAICSMHFGGVFERFPTLRVAFAHGGGAFAGTLGRIQHGFEARPDLCAVDTSTPPAQAIGRFFVDSLVHDERTLRLIVDVFGEDFICIGSDQPFPLGEARPGALVERVLEGEARDKVLWKNAQRWLG
jgi:aminocarboxymuconate-semialdehyde decarboxylase